MKEVATPLALLLVGDEAVPLALVEAEAVADAVGGRKVDAVSTLERAPLALWLSGLIIPAKERVDAEEGTTEALPLSDVAPE